MPLGIEFLSERDEIWQPNEVISGNLATFGVWPIETFPEFRELWSGGLVIPSAICIA